MQILPHKLKKATSTRTGKIIVLVISILILAGSCGAVFYWHTYKKKIIRNKLEGAVREKTEGLYTLHYDNLSLDEVAGDLVISNLTLAYDSVKYKASLLEKEAPPILLSITRNSGEKDTYQGPGDQHHLYQYRKRFSQKYPGQRSL
jgi:hypothetical protein